MEFILITVGLAAGFTLIFVSASLISRATGGVK